MSRVLLKAFEINQLNITRQFNHLGKLSNEIKLVKYVSTYSLYAENKSKALFKNNLMINQNSIARFSLNYNPDGQKWSKILMKAEKIVGYPTSFLNLRYLVSDEVAHFAQLLKKLIKTKHPLMKMARRFILSTDKAESKRTLQINGLIILLISKAAGLPTCIDSSQSLFTNDFSDGIHNSQRCLAEIAEMIYMGMIIHKGVLDLKTVDSAELSDMDQGNKLAVLCGDYLLANACTNLAKLRNTEVVELMSQVILEMSQDIFDQSSKLTFLMKWYNNINCTSSLLAYSAKSAMILVQHPPKLQENAFEFAKNLDIAYKIWSEYIDYKKGVNNLIKKDTIFNAIYKDKYENTNEIEFREKNILDECKMLFNNHYNLALASLKLIENNPGNSNLDAIESLGLILETMKTTI